MVNLHPRIFVSHESDIAWILYQLYRGQSFRGHPWDSPVGMNTTLETAGYLLRRGASPMENFLAVQLLMMKEGSPWLKPQVKTDLSWIGDKKPMQHTDPQLLEFMLDNFPDARFVHIVRHPFEVVASSDRFNRTPEGDFWLGLSSAEKLERWAFHEDQVLRLRERMPQRLHSIRYEDFCTDTESKLAELFRFLELESSPDILRDATQRTRPAWLYFQSIEPSLNASRIAHLYGYDLTPHPTHWRVVVRNLYRRVVRKIGNGKNRAARRF